MCRCTTPTFPVPGGGVQRKHGGQHAAHPVPAGPGGSCHYSGHARVHGMPVQIGEPEAIGIHDLAHPDYGDAVTINPGETPVFWPCGVTPQNVVMHSKPEFCITHAPGHMFVTDVKMWS